MVFYYHFEKELLKAKAVVLTNGKPTEYIVDKIVCSVQTTTSRNTTHPLFVVCGICKKAEILNNVLYLS